MEKKIKINSTSLYLKVFYFHICDGQVVATIQLWLQTKYEVRNIYKPSYFLATYWKLMQNLNKSSQRNSTFYNMKPKKT